jgi:hypothetical protein
VNSCINSAVRDLQTLFEAGSVGGLSDGQLLDRFVARQEGAIFEAVLLVASVVVVGGTGLTYRARATEPTIQYATPDGEPIQEAKPVDATTQEPKPKEQPVEEAKPVEPARGKEETKARSDDPQPGKPTPTIPNESGSTLLRPSDAPPMPIQDAKPPEAAIPPHVYHKTRTRLLTTFNPQKTAQLRRLTKIKETAKVGTRHREGPAEDVR